ncbi:hypothetical protein T03_5185 [Trichinella britovi]|uniref:Uncharacterized protein n=1 Tax=Trichinella britovi TaxID=45882 RepID=A0A0V1CP75_TRIBR|nr:hypothetical protein T03_5185 [Trichinella britovi]
MSILYIIFSIRGNVSPKLHSNVSWQVCIFTIYYFFMWTDLSIVKKKQMIINFNHVIALLQWEGKRTSNGIVKLCKTAAALQEAHNF